MGMKKILIVERQVCLSQYLQSDIQAVGLKSDHATSLEACQTLIEENSYFLVLFDTGFLPKELQAISEALSSANLPFIAVTQRYKEQLQMSYPQRLLIDTVYKETPEAIAYLIKAVKRIAANRDTKVLVVEDSDSDRALMSGLVRQQLYLTYEARDAEEAKAYLENNPDIKIIITDIHMPGMDGVGLLKYVRERKLQNELAILGVSADWERLIDFLKLGGNDFVTKPFHKAEFVSRLNNLVSVYQHIQALDALSNHDFLTKLYSRKYFFEKAAPYVFRAYHEKSACAVGMIDIDDFKAINDTYGHDIGDKVIQKVAKVLHNGLKGSDIVARYGGEEFCVLLKDTTMTDAQKVFESLREKVSREVVRKIAFPEGIDISFSVSIGVCTKVDGTLDAMLSQADSRLYEAKRNGKNRVVSSALFELEEVI